MNIDEARDRLKEHDALRAFVTQVKMIAPDAAPATIQVSFEVAQALLHVAIWRCNELALAFEESKSAPATVAPATPAGRPKVKPAVVERWGAFAGPNDDDWETWALKKGFKWGSVQACLRDLEKQKKAHVERLDPLNTGVTKAAENFATQHAADIQKDTFAKLATRG